METAQPKLRHRILRPLKTKFNEQKEKKKGGGNDGAVHCKARTQIPLSLGSKIAVPSSSRGRVSSPVQEQSGIRGLSS